MPCFSQKIKGGGIYSCTGIYFFKLADNYGYTYFDITIDSELVNIAMKPIIAENPKLADYMHIATISIEIEPE